MAAFAMKLDFSNPTYQAALAAERSARDFVFAGLPVTICGVTVRLMTLRDLLWLLDGRNAFLCAGEVGPEHVAQLLWVLSPEFTTDAARKQQFLDAIAEIEFADACASIREYLDMIFYDLPGSSRDSDDAPEYSFAAAMVNAIAGAYGWSEEKILTLPLPALYQYRAAIRRSPPVCYSVEIRFPDAPAFNRVRDKYIGEILRAAKKTRAAESAPAEPAAPAAPADSSLIPHPSALPPAEPAEKVGRQECQPSDSDLSALRNPQSAID